MGEQRIWAMGSTYERGHTDLTVTAAAHARNATSLHTLCPAAHEDMQAQQAAGTLNAWVGIRCASLDRLPLVGAVPALGLLKPSLRLSEVPRIPGLWTVCAMGSRGLTLAELAAELLSAHMESEPWPLPQALGEALDPARFALKATRTAQA
jgi:tRNA 5-methylaminomethyl-2-thiouridine biosynthesis bifunctional protein